MVDMLRRRAKKKIGGRDGGNIRREREEKEESQG